MRDIFITQRVKTLEKNKDDVAKKSLEALVCGIDQVSQATLLLKKKKEMHEIDDALDLVKSDYKERMEACEERREKFEKKQNEMKENVAKFAKFIQENDAKRQRSEARVKNERKQLEQKQNEEKQLYDELRKLQDERASQIEKLEKFRHYKDYLENVVEHSESAEEIQDIIHRHTTLKIANEDLIEQVQRGDNEMDSLRTKIETLKSKTQNILLVQNSQIQTKSKYLEQIRTQTKKQDECKYTRDERVKDVTRETAQIINAIRNIYQRCVATNRAKTGGRVTINESTFSQRNSTAWEQQRKELCLCLDLIRDRITDLNDIHLRGGADSFFSSNTGRPTPALPQVNTPNSPCIALPPQRLDDHFQRGSALQAAASSLLLNVAR